jgi:carbamoyltransferase
MQPPDPWILGIAASHNGGACLIHGDEIVAAVQEERLVRCKRALTRGGCNPLSVRYCLEVAGIAPRDLNLVVLCAAQSNRSTHNDLRLNNYLRVADYGIPFLSIPHHLGHAIGAFATSGFSSAAVLVVDGMGSPFADLTPDEQAAILGNPHQGHESISLYVASESSIRPLEKHLVDGGAWLERRLSKSGMQCFGTLGGMYSAVAEQIFGDPLDGAGKVMGLAPYGAATLAPAEFFVLSEGQFRFKETVPRLFESAERWPLRQNDYVDLAASVQQALEEGLLSLAQRLRRLSNESHLCYAGGVALNSVANERIARESGFDHVFYMPAAEDSGTAIGAAYFGLWSHGSTQAVRSVRPDALGKNYSPHEIAAAIDSTPAIAAQRSRDPARDAAELLLEGKIIGWFQGGAEFGPRALGQRSILADARNPDIKERLNRSVKGRESFRPFAPVILQEDVATWFEVERSFASSYMLRVCRFREEMACLVPGVVHVDGTGRVQTVRAEDYPDLYALLQETKARTGVPLLLNTSFNIAGEPIVETPPDALWTLLNCGLDGVVIGDYLVSKVSQYRSVLDLVGVLSAESFTLHEPVPSENPNPYQRLPYSFSEEAEPWMRSEIDSLGLPYVTFRVIGPLGPVIHAFPVETLRVVQLLDGHTSGRELLVRLRSQGDGQADAKKLAATLHALGSRGIATFTAPREWLV